MNRQKLTSPVPWLLGLVLLTIACQAPEFFQLTLIGPDQGPVRSNFVPPRDVIRVQVGRPLPLESFHAGSNKLAAVEVFVNGQPVRAEETAGQPAFPVNLAAVEVLTRDRPPAGNLAGLAYPSAPCRSLARQGGVVQTNALELRYPASHWSVCHVWIALVPGVYDLSVVAIDQTGQRGEPIVQRIEVSGAP
jgi:hypothetical protein